MSLSTGKGKKVLRPLISREGKEDEVEFWLLLYCVSLARNQALRECSTTFSLLFWFWFVPLDLPIRTNLPVSSNLNCVLGSIKVHVDLNPNEVEVDLDYLAEECSVNPRLADRDHLAEECLGVQVATESGRLQASQGHSTHTAEHQQLELPHIHAHNTAKELPSGRPRRQY